MTIPATVGGSSGDYYSSGLNGYDLGSGYVGGYGQPSPQDTYDQQDEPERDGWRDRLVSALVRLRGIGRRDSDFDPAEDALTSDIQENSTRLQDPRISMWHQ